MSDVRDLSPGMGQAVGERTVLRKDESGVFENWADVAKRVSLGNAGLVPGCADREVLEYYTSTGALLWSGRHLQHGDANQSERNMEVFTNCSTAATSALSFGLLLNGSGVGRSYDDDMMVVDWDMAPALVLHMSKDHPDYDESLLDDVPADLEPIIYHVEDSREGWMKALEIYETMTFHKNTGHVLILDFSFVREKNAPIGGMQGRPSCGPVPTMEAFLKVRDNVVGCGYPLWFQSMMVDHYFAHSVLVGGARRSARIAVKNWRDPDISDFINCKSKYDLYTANNSVGVDQDFWDEVHSEYTFGHDEGPSAKDIFNAITHAGYHHGTGEPGFLNLHKICQNEEGIDWVDLYKGEWAGSKKYQFDGDTKDMHAELAHRVHKKKYKFIVNPCAEIPLFILGGFCVIGDVVPHHCKNLEDFAKAAVAMARALIRVNTMDSMYNTEVRRTNRIGVGLTGIHEWMWSKYATTFNDVVSPSRDVDAVARALIYVRDMVEDAARAYSDELGLNHPHTFTTIKPAGTTSKLFALTEGCHLPAMSAYLRWVQFRWDDPLVYEYTCHGYPTKKLKSKPDIMLIGFPTVLPLGAMGIGDALTYAGEATMLEQFRWLMFLEKNWLGENGNQVSYTLKYDPKVVSYEDFARNMFKYMPMVRCVSVMPQVDMTAYEYQPEEPITVEEYYEKMKHIEAMKEDVGREHVDCEGGGCPVDFNEGDK